MSIAALKNNTFFKNVLKRQWFIVPACLVAIVFFNRSKLPLFSQDLSLSDYKVVDSGFWVSPTRKILWLDNQRVMFQSNQTLSPDGYDYEGGYKNAIWDTSNGNVSFADSWKKSRIVCAKENQVVCVKMDPLKNQIAWYRGPLGHLKPYPRPDEDMVIDKKFDCVWESKKDTKNSPGGPYPWRRRLRGTNYIEVIERSTSSNKVPRYIMETCEKVAWGTPLIEKAVYYERPGIAGLPLPIQFGGWSGCDFTSIRYIKWKGAYFFSPYQHYEDIQLTVWWLTPQGEITKEKLPDNLPFSTAPISFYPVKAGLMIDIGGLPKGPGAYFFHEGKVEPLIEYPILNAAISPDGCKAAFVHTTNIHKFGNYNDKDRTLKIIDFCRDEVNK